MSTITWIVIVLIIISIAVTVTEVGLRFIILEKAGGSAGKVLDMGRNWSRGDFNAGQLESICGVGYGFAEL